MSYQTALLNHTPFAAEKFVLLDVDGQEVILVVMAATFEQPKGGAFAPLEEQPPVHAKDVFAGPEGESSLLFEGELALEKPRIDVLVVGQAHAPGGGARELPIALEVGDIRKRLVVSGHRVWSGGVASKPIPFTTMPLRYELAYGGTSDDGKRVFGENPIGIGYGKARSRLDGKSELPNFEYPHARLTGPSAETEVAGFGALGRHFAPRLKYAGTYDDAWLAERWPLLPVDFNPLFNQCAPKDQQSTSLRGGETARLLNLTPDGFWEFRLPTLLVPVHLHFDDGLRDAAMRLDTIVIEPDLRRVRMTSRLSFKVDRRARRLREIVLGNMSPTWLRAMRERKVYVDLGRTQGVDRSRVDFS